LRIGQRWPEDGMRKCEGIFAQALSTYPLTQYPSSSIVNVFEIDRVAMVERPLKNVEFCSSSREAKILTEGIH
jgi:hypothetical protein